MSRATHQPDPEMFVLGRDALRALVEAGGKDGRRAKAEQERRAAKRAERRKAREEVAA